MAAYYSALSSSGEPPILRARLARASRLAAHTSDRERLTILAGEAFLASSPAQRALADTLVARYPEEVQGHFFTGLSRMVDGEFLQALPSLNRVVAMDSLALLGDRASCEACDALRQIVSAYQLADSLPAAEREARRWVRLQPRSVAARQTLADVLSQRGRADEALAELDQTASFDGGRGEGERLLRRAVHRIYAGDFEQADRLLAGELESGAPFRQNQALWYRALSLRQQGRLAEALTDARRHRALGMSSYPRGIAARLHATPPEALAEAQILFEMGRYRAAAALFDSVSRWVVGDESPSQVAHARVWAWSHAAGALAAAGDTAGLLRRADSLETLAGRSALGRDHLLHHYVRGLVLAARRQDEAASTAFRRSVWSWNFGYTRANVVLAKSLLHLGRPSDAVAALQSALRGSVEASNFYVTRTELHELLGQAWDAVGGKPARDSARAHFSFVVRAWSRADPSFAQRLREARERMAADSAQ
jgi:tetratricopeptide (TPR) repeat protein